MSTYEYLCLTCQRLFLKILTMAEAGMQKIVYLLARAPSLSSFRQLFTRSREKRLWRKLFLLPSGVIRARSDRVDSA
jgi:hypothetical protein